MCILINDCSGFDDDAFAWRTSSNARKTSFCDRTTIQVVLVFARLRLLLISLLLIRHFHRALYRLQPYHTSSSCRIMFGIPSLTGNLRPVSGHTNCPSTTCTSKSTVCRLATRASSIGSSAVGSSAGSSGKGPSHCPETSRKAPKSVSYLSFGNNLVTNSRSTGDSSITTCVTSILRGYPFSVLRLMCNGGRLAHGMDKAHRAKPRQDRLHRDPALRILTLGHWTGESCVSRASLCRTLD